MMSIRSARSRRPARSAWPALLALLVLTTAFAPAALAATPRQLLDEPLLEAEPDPRGNGRLFAVTLDHRLLRSVDGGESWQEIGTGGAGLPAAGVEDLEIDPLQPDFLYAVPSTPATPLYRSTDGGDTWQPAGEPSSQIDEVAVAEASAGEVILVGAGGERVFRSADRGETWTEVGTLGLAGDTGFRPRQPILTDGRPDLVYLTGTYFIPGFCGAFCAEERLYRSLDGGATWELLDLPFRDGPGHLRTDPREPNALYAVAESTVFRSGDRGESWAGTDVPHPVSVDLLVDPRRAGTLFRATFTAGVYHSPDRGQTWRRVAPGFAPEQLRDLSFVDGAAGPATLLAAGQGGLWALEVAPPVPDGPSFTDPAIAGFRVWVRISAGDGEALPVRAESVCIPETLCVSGSLPGRSEVFVRVVGPKPNGNLWPTLVKFTTSRVEVWIEQLSTGEVEYYDLPGATPGVDRLDGLFDRDGFEP